MESYRKLFYVLVLCVTAIALYGQYAQSMQ